MRLRTYSRLTESGKRAAEAMRDTARERLDSWPECCDRSTNAALVDLLEACAVYALSCNPELRDRRVP